MRRVGWGEACRSHATWCSWISVDTDSPLPALPRRPARDCSQGVSMCTRGRRRRNNAHTSHAQCSHCRRAAAPAGTAVCACVGGDMNKPSANSNSRSPHAPCPHAMLARSGSGDIYATHTYRRQALPPRSRIVFGRLNIYIYIYIYMIVTSVGD